MFPHYIYWVVFFGLMINSAGIPMPGEIWLLTGGAIIGSGKLNLTKVILAAVSGAIIGDSIAFFMGRFGGRRLIDLYCNYTLCPIQCSEKASAFYKRFGVVAVPIARFIPGVRLLMVPMAGASRMTFLRFFALDFFGVALWVGTYVFIGFIFRDIISEVIFVFEKIGRGVIIIILFVIVIILFRLLKKGLMAKLDRRRVIQRLRLFLK